VELLQPPGGWPVGWSMFAAIERQRLVVRAPSRRTGAERRQQEPGDDKRS
jgi:hypothetical protein